MTPSPYFNQPTGVLWDANGRQYVWEKGGRVWIINNGVRLPAPLIDISAEVGNWRDHGLLGFALDPNFLSNGRVYLMYGVDRHHLMNFGTRELQRHLE
ncbi:MAG: PQQ-dependent sugar dehydrogenase [Flavobacteriales bacterium]